MGNYERMSAHPTKAQAATVRYDLRDIVDAILWYLRGGGNGATYWRTIRPVRLSVTILGSGRKTGH